MVADDDGVYAGGNGSGDQLVMLVRRMSGFPA
jgi:hypothetical protein